MDIINIILDEIIAAIEAFATNQPRTAYAIYLDWVGDTNKLLGSKDYGASCALFWSEANKYGFESNTDLKVAAAI